MYQVAWEYRESGLFAAPVGAADPMPANGLLSCRPPFPCESIHGGTHSGARIDGTDIVAAAARPAAGRTGDVRAVFDRHPLPGVLGAGRSDEGRGGKECVHTFSSRWLLLS